MKLNKPVKLIVWHCSATKPYQTASAEDIDKWHKERGFDKIGYHIVVRRDGTIEYGRGLDEVGAHVKGYNRGSIGCVWEGGLNLDGYPTDDRTPAQKEAMHRVTVALMHLFPQAMVLGHRDLSPDLDGDGIVEKEEWLKECPCFDVKEWMNEVNL